MTKHQYKIRALLGLCLVAWATGTPEVAAQDGDKHVELDLLNVYYYGGSGGQGEIVNDAILGQDGYLYLAGNTESMDLRLAKRPQHEGWKAFATKLSTDGEPQWSTYIVNDGNTGAEGIAVDREGNVFVCGSAYDKGVLSGFKGDQEGEGAFLTSIAPNGDIHWSIFLTNGSGSFNKGMAVAIDPDGNAYVTGSVSGDENLLGGNPEEHNGGWDAFVTKVTPSGSTAWARFIGGEERDIGHGIRVDGAGNLYVVGEIFWEYSNGKRVTGGDCKLVKARNKWHGEGRTEGFLTRMNASSGQVEWSLYLGGSEGEDCSDVAIDGAGNAYVSGSTSSSDLQPPPTNNKNCDDGEGFILKVDPLAKIHWITLVDGTWGTSADRLIWTGGQLVGLVNGRVMGAIAVDPGSGKKLWYRSLRGLVTQTEAGIGVNKDGRIFLVGNAEESDMDEVRNVFAGGNTDAVVTELVKTIAPVGDAGSAPQPPTAKDPFFSGTLVDGSKYKEGVEIPMTWFIEMPEKIVGFTTLLDGEVISKGGASSSGDGTGASAEDVLKPDSGEHEWKLVVVTADGKEFEETISFTVISTTPSVPPKPPERPRLDRPGLVAQEKSVLPGETVVIAVNAVDVSKLGSLNFILRYDPDVATVEKVDKGDLPERSGAMFKANPNETGIIRFGFAGSGGMSGNGPMAQIRFKAVGEAGDETDLTITQIDPTDTGGNALNLAKQDGKISIIKEEEIGKGDTNNDGKVNILDSLDALSMSVKLIPEDLNADMDENGRVTAEDARRILVEAIQ